MQIDPAWQPLKLALQRVVGLEKGEELFHWCWRESMKSPHGLERFVAHVLARESMARRLMQ